VRHDRIDMLEKLKELCIHVRHTLSSSGIIQDIYTSVPGMLKGTGKKLGAERVLRGNELTYYVSSIPEEKLPKGIANGHFLIGELSFYKDFQISKIVPIIY
jgi:hypothetical protein